MAYDYRPKDPRGKLREVVTKYLSNMRIAGRAPNRGVIFDVDAADSPPPQTSGWLLADQRPGARGDNYLLLDDGDVWRAPAERSGASPALDAAVEAWLAEPDDDLVTLLARSLADARLGGSGYLADAGAPVQRVADRRAAHQPRSGPERRAGS